jgi:carbon monoxide dehydrogenase subunit G
VPRSVRESIELAASPAEVWDAVMDPARLGEWVTAHDSVEHAAPGPLAEGDEFTQKLRLAGKSFKVRWRVVDADRPRLAVWEGDGPAGSTANVAYRLAESGDGTRFEYENEFALPGGALGKAAGGLLSAAPGSREARRSLQNLKALLED